MTDEKNEGEWVWVGDAESYHVNWNKDSGEPNGGWGEKCAEMIIDGAWRGRWNDDGCDGTKQPIICEKRKLGR